MKAEPPPGRPRGPVATRKRTESARLRIARLLRHSKRRGAAVGRSFFEGARTHLPPAQGAEPEALAANAGLGPKAKYNEYSLAHLQK